MKIAVIPDVQAKPGNDFTFLTHIGRWLVDKQPDVIVNIGDFADMPSLSSYDIGKKSFEGRRYLADIEAATSAMHHLMHPITLHNRRQAKNNKRQYKPDLVLTLGNHEERIVKAVNDDAKLEGVLSLDHLGYKEAGWTVYPFLEVVVIENIAFSHYYVTGVAGRPASTATAQLRKTNMSSIAGHQQGLQIATGSRADGSRLTSVIAGSCYEHDEDYLSPQVNNTYWRGALMLHNVQDGQFDLVPTPLSYLKEKYSDRRENGK